MKKLVKQPIRPTPVYALSIIFILLCVVGVIAPNPVNFSDLDREAIAEVGTTALLVYWLYSNRKVRNIILTISATRLFLIALFVFASLSVFWTAQIAFFASKYLIWLGVANIIVLALALEHNTKTYIVLARMLVLAGSYIAVIGLTQSLFSVDIFVQGKPPAATFINRNAAAQVIVLIFPMSLFLLLVDKHKYLIKLYPYAASLMLAFIFHTNTRAAWLSCSLEILLIIIAIFWQKKHIKEFIKTRDIYAGFKESIHLILAAVLLLLLINLSAEGWTFFGDKVIGNTLSLYKNLHSYGDVIGEASRYRGWEAAIGMIKQNPFMGSGMGSFFHNIITQTERHSEYSKLRAHNDLLELAVELGVIGCALLFGAIVGLLTALYKLITQGGVEQRLFYLLITSALAGSALNMQFSFPYQMPVPLLIFGLYVGCIIKSGDIYNTRIKTIELTLDNRHWDLSTFFVGLILASVVMINFNWLNTSAKITHGISTGNGWPSNIVSNSLVCHKLLAKSFYDVVVNDDTKKHGEELHDSLNKCVPNTWAYHSAKSRKLIRARKYKEAIKVLELAKQVSPKGIYADTINQITAYYSINDAEGGLRVYEELTAQPNEMLVKEREFFQALILISLQLERKKQAKEYYQVYRRYYDDAEFIAKVGRFFKDAE